MTQAGIEPATFRFVAQHVFIIGSCNLKRQLYIQFSFISFKTYCNFEGQPVVEWNIFGYFSDYFKYTILILKCAIPVVCINK